MGFFGGRDLQAFRRDRIASDIAAAANTPELGSRLRDLGIAVRAGTPAQFAAAIEEQRLKVRDIIWSEKKAH